MGLRLALFKKCEANQFSINTDQLVFLILLELFISIIAEYFLALPEPNFVTYAIPTFSLEQLVSFLVVFILLKAWDRSQLFTTVLVIVSSVSIVFKFIEYIEKYFDLSTSIDASHTHWYQYFICIYALIVIGRAIYISSGKLKYFTAFALLTFLLVSVVEYCYFGEYQEFWYQSEKDGIQTQDTWSKYLEMDSEALMYQQTEILNTSLNTLKAGVKDKNDLYFVGFASYATEDVFLKEVSFAKKTMDKRFGTKDRSITLINHLTTRDIVPLANATNLKRTLKHIGQLMNKEEDILFLYLTSHGSKDHTLSISFWPLALNDMTPINLKSMLDESGIKWKIIVISACYSGGFINILEDTNTLIATAAAADKTSFGCSNESEFTYFGEALFKHRLSKENSFVNSFELVKADIGERELIENLEPSLPQLFVGESIKTKLEIFDEEMKELQCKLDKNTPAC